MTEWEWKVLMSSPLTFVIGPVRIYTGLWCIFLFGRFGFVKFTGRNEWPLSCVKRHGGLPVRRASPHRQAGNPLQCIQMRIEPAGEFHEGTVSYYCLIWLEIVRLRSIWPWLNTRLSLVIRIVNQLVSLLW